MARSVCWRSGRSRGAGGEHVERVVEPLEQRLRRQEPQPRGGELERERQPVQAPADRRDRAFVRRRQLARLARARSTNSATAESISSGASGYSRSAAILQRRPAGGDDPELRAALDEPGHLGRGRVDDLLEVVEEQERLPVADQRDDALAERPLLGLLHVEGLREGGHEVRGVGDVSQRDERDAVEELGREQPAELDEDARLADPAGAGDRDDSVLADEVGERRQVVGAADERRGRLGQVARQAREPLALPLERGRIRHDEPVGRDRVELERPADVLEPEPPERDDVDVAPILDLLRTRRPRASRRRARRRTRSARRC